jgi:hypothetical protein
MPTQLSNLEEFDIISKIQFPHLLYAKMTPENKRNVAFSVLARKEAELLLISALAFREGSIVAGISEKQMEYFALNAPREHREALMEAVSDIEVIREILEIAKFMDEEIANGSIQNEQRVARVFDYIQENKIVFMF